jgi:hypothetical protein
VFGKLNTDVKSRVILLYLAIVGIIDVSGRIFDFSELIKLLFNSIFTIIEFSIFSFFFYLSFKSKKLKRTILLLYIIFIPSACYFLFMTIRFFKTGVIYFDSMSVSISAIIILFYSIVFLFDLIQRPQIEFVYATFEFWVIVGIMIFFSGTFFLFLQIQRLTPAELESYWAINLIGNILKNILFGIAFTQPRVKNEMENTMSSGGQF